MSVRSFLALLTMFVAVTLGAQTAPDSTTGAARPVADTSADSLLVRLQRAEEAIALLRQQLAAQAASATQTESRARFDIGGRVLMNAFYNTWRVNNADVPQFARPDTNVGGRLLHGGLGAGLRQSTLRGTAFVPRVLGADFTGDIDVDFYGGQQASPGGRNFPLLRIRTARGALRWRNAELMAGQDGPLVSGIEPISVAAVGVPEFGTAGNLWMWLPQLRLTVEHADSSLRFGVQAAVLAPTNGDAAGLFDTGVDQAERSRRPMLEARARVRWGPEDTGGEIGIGVHRSWLAAANNDSLIDSQAIVANALVPIGWFELRGEAFTGKALRGLGGGGIAQSVNSRGEPVRTRGAWAQVDVRFSSLVTAGGGCGADTPNRDDLPTPNAAAIAATRLRNVVCEGHIITRPDGPIVAGITFRRLRTSYAEPIGVLADQHFNLTLGYAF
jgi:hypothetical protein